MTEIVKKGSYVQIHRIELTSEERTGKIPEDTKQVPLESWVKGFLIENAQIGELSKIKTVTNRVIEGKLVEENPTYHYGFGKTYLPDLLKVGISLRAIMKGENE